MWRATFVLSKTFYQWYFNVHKNQSRFSNLLKLLEKKVALLIIRATFHILKNYFKNGYKCSAMNFPQNFSSLLKNYFNIKLFTSQRNIFRFGKYFQNGINISSCIFGTRASWLSDTICYSRWSIWKLRPRNVCSRFRFEPTCFYCVVSLKFLFAISSPGLGWTSSS
jgi:hypothetical protein